MLHYTVVCSERTGRAQHWTLYCAYSCFSLSLALVILLHLSRPSNCVEKHLNVGPLSQQSQKKSNQHPPHATTLSATLPPSTAEHQLTLTLHSGQHLLCWPQASSAPAAAFDHLYFRSAAQVARQAGALTQRHCPVACTPGLDPTQQALPCVHGGRL